MPAILIAASLFLTAVDDGQTPPGRPAPELVRVRVKDRGSINGAMSPVARVGLEVTAGLAGGAVGFFAGAAVAAGLQVLALNLRPHGARVGLWPPTTQPWSTTWLWVGGAVGGAIATSFAVGLTGSALGGSGSRLVSAATSFICMALVASAWGPAGAPEKTVPLMLAGGLASSVLAFEVSGLAVAPAITPGAAGVAVRGSF